MRYADFQEFIGIPRINKYVLACAGNKSKAIKLYKANISLSQKIFSVLSIFEIVLRNKIDQHYRSIYGSNWLFQAVQKDGFLQTRGCEKSRETIECIITILGYNYNPDKAIAELTLGFWAYLFASKQFAAAGSTLLNIFPNRPFRTNHTTVFNLLKGLKMIRNRVAHHEPICFDSPLSISTSSTEQQYDDMIALLKWLNVDPTSLLSGIDRVKKEITYINSIQ
jgi:hypothetical protein